MVSVEVQNVTKCFGAVKAVDEVSFRVDDGKLFFLLGPSGCGKTTLLRLVAGFYKPDKGKIFLGNQLMNDVPPHRRSIGMVFQNYALWPHMTVYDNIAYGLRIRGVPTSQRVERVKEILKVVKMEEFASRYPNQLSGGQQQRIALARALVIEPDVLLLDEPLSNLDAKLRLETRDEIKRIQRELKVTTIYVTHDQEEALSMADEIAIMNSGRIEQVGTPQEIYNRPRNVFVASFLGSTNILKGRVEREDHVGLLTIVCDGGMTICASRKGLNVKVGDNVYCAIRPEKIKVHDPDSHLEGIINLIRARILSLVYYGVTEQYLLSYDSVEVKVTNFNPSGHLRSIGQTVYLAFDPEDVFVFPTL
ncbi:MAG: ABC transporter ATP-binding protein [Candidatus Bathyarchaeia archaeon]